MKAITYKFNNYSRAFLLFGAGLVLIVSALLPLAVSRDTSAATLESRSLTISSGQSADTGVTYTYGFTTKSAYAIQSIKFVACDTAVDTYGLGGGSGTGTCTGPNLMNINQGTQASASFAQSGAWSRTTSNTGNCAPANNVLCVTRTQGTNESAGAKSIGWNTQTNPTIPSGNGYSFYVGIYIYTDTGYSTQAPDSGTVASAVVQSLQVNAAVAEILNFCVGSTSVDDVDTTSPGADCSAISGTAVNLGTLDSGKVSVTPETTNCSASDCGKNGITMLRTNASGGATISYDSIQQSLLSTNHRGSLLKSGGTCNDTFANDLNVDNTDDCFNTRSTPAQFDTTNERFGMTVAGVNCESTDSYTCAGTGTSSANLTRDTDYDCDGSATYPTGDVDQINGPTDCDYAWDESGTITQIASSTGSTIKQVDDEALLLKFAAHPMLTTPFGAYTAQADFISVATY
jgi:hypothetical protein